MADLAHTAQAPLIVGGLAADYSPEQNGWLDYNSAIIVGPDGARVGRYDKIHLVPFGEYIPFQNFLFFAHKLTGRVSSFSRGDGAQGLPSRTAHSLRRLHLLRSRLRR